MTELFTYGTLKKGGKWHHLLEDQQFVAEDKVEGEMFIENGSYYPIMFVGADLISGEVWSVDDEAYQRACDLESDANYRIELVQTVGGRMVMAFYMDDTQKPEGATPVNNFDAAAYFEKWKNDVDPESASYEEYIRLGGKPIK